MNVTDNNKIDIARKIVETIASSMHVNTKDLLSGRRFRDVSYSRRLAVYFIRSYTGLPHKMVAALVGFKRQQCSIDQYLRVRNEYKTDQEVKAHVIAFKELINQLAA